MWPFRRNKWTRSMKAWRRMVRREEAFEAKILAQAGVVPPNPNQAKERAFSQAVEASKGVYLDDGSDDLLTPMLLEQFMKINRQKGVDTEEKM